jgi:NAD(P)H-dependent flavin oxidoreductase YrpB (nitropropane dioxygenase family)
MLRTRFTDLVGCTVPIQQAGMGGALGNPTLAAAVANAGAQGMVFWNGLPPDLLAEQLAEARRQTQGVIGVNFLVPFLEEDRDEICRALEVAATRANVIDFFWADPDRSMVEQAHAGGALVCWQVGSLAEAEAAVEVGCDFIVAQGIEAGGHVRGHIGVLALLDQVLPAVDVPVLAAGGIGSGRGMAAVLAAGADGARLGTRFVAAEEARAHPTYVNALIAAEAGDTVYTEAFSFGWPDAPHRCLRSCVEAATAFDGDVVGERFVASYQKRMPVHRFESLGVTDDATGEIEAMSLWAGESVSGVKRNQPAAAIVTELVEEAEALLKRWA